jgi:hypothetical protein
MDKTTGTGAPLEPLVPVLDARQILGGVSSQTIYRLVKRGDLRLVKIRRRSFIRLDDLQLLIASSTQKRPQ